MLLFKYTTMDLHSSMFSFFTMVSEIIMNVSTAFTSLFNVLATGLALLL